MSATGFKGHDSKLMTVPAKHRVEKLVGKSARDVALGVLDGYIAFHLQLAQNASFKNFKREAGQSDLRPGRFAVLAIIHDNPGITPLALSRASGRDKSTITPMLRDLERLQALVRRPNVTDKRSHVLHLTPAGEEMYTHLAACAAAHDRQLDAIMGDRKDELIALLRRVETAFD